MADTTLDTIKRGDEVILEKIKPMISKPQRIGSMSDEQVRQEIDWCLDRLRRLRMGGRTAPLPWMAVLLWHAHGRWPGVQFNVEESFAQAFRVSFDPSFVMPEWAIVIVGVLLARYSDKIPEHGEDGKRIREEVLTQSRLMLCECEGGGWATTPARLAAMSLLECWDMSFPEGLQPVVRTALDTWPRTESIARISQEKLDSLIAEMSRTLPRWMTERDRRVYRLYLERKGTWSVFESAVLR